MAMNKVEICGVDTSTLPVISNERMRELFPLFFKQTFFFHDY